MQQLQLFMQSSGGILFTYRFAKEDTEYDCDDAFEKFMVSIEPYFEESSYKFYGRALIVHVTVSGDSDPYCVLTVRITACELSSLKKVYYLARECVDYSNLETITFCVVCDDGLTMCDY